MNERPNDLTMWTIYKSPFDYPDKYVVRQHIVRSGVVVASPKCVVVWTLADARKQVPHGLVNLGRMDEDEPQIVETWV